MELKKTPNLMTKALSILARREHSRWELAQKLSSWTEDKNLIEAVLNECETQNWLNETRFVEAYIRYRSQKLYGPKKIAYELQQKKIASELIETSLSKSNINWEELSERAKQKKFGSAEAKSSLEKAKHQQYLYQRGF